MIFAENKIFGQNKGFFRSLLFILHFLKYIIPQVYNKMDQKMFFWIVEKNKKVDFIGNIGLKMGFVKKIHGFVKKNTTGPKFDFF